MNCLFKYAGECCKSAGYDEERLVEQCSTECEDNLVHGCLRDQSYDSCRLLLDEDRIRHCSPCCIHTPKIQALRIKGRKAAGAKNTKSKPSGPAEGTLAPSNSGEAGDSAVGQDWVQRQRSPSCDLDRIDAREMSEELLAATLENAPAPVIVENAIKHWQSLTAWQDKQRFLRSHARVAVWEDDSLEVQQKAANGRAGALDLGQHIFEEGDARSKIAFAFETTPGGTATKEHSPWMDEATPRDESNTCLYWL